MNNELEPLNPFAARSFWAALFALVLPILNGMGYYPAEFLGLERGNSVALLELIWPVALVMYAMYERRAPKRRLSITGPLV